MGRLIDDLRGTLSITDLARRVGAPRSTVSRWLSNATQPRLPDFLRAIEAASLRLVDWLASFVEPESIPAVHAVWQTIEKRRRGALERPWTQAVLSAVVLADYQTLPAHEDGWIARRLGISTEEEPDRVSTPGAIPS